MYFFGFPEQTQPLIPVLKIFLFVSHCKINLSICCTPDSLIPLDSTQSTMTRALNKSWIGISCGHIVFRIKKLNSAGNGARFNCSMTLNCEVSRQSSVQEIEAVKGKWDIFQMPNFTSKGLVLQGRRVCNCNSPSLCRGLQELRPSIQIGLFDWGLARFPWRQDKEFSAINGQVLILNKEETKL